MKDILAYEKSLYFKSGKDYLISMVTHEDNYLIWRYVRYLRKEEAAPNKLVAYWYRRKKNDLGAKLGLTIYVNTCGRGLHIWHHGGLVINGDAKIGENCTFHGQCCIGNDGSSDGAPVIGDNVEIGVGAMIIGDIHIADGVKIGAGAVVTKSCHEKGATLVGVPAKPLKK